MSNLIQNKKKIVGMSNQIQKTSIGVVTETDLNTLYQAGIIPEGTPRPQIDIFANVCKERGLSPFSKEIYLVGYKGRYSVIVGINGFRKIAAETQQLAGVDDAKFDLKSDGTFKTASELHGKAPSTATVIVYRVIGGVRCPFTHTAVFTEFSTGRQKWQSMPFQMIAKVAEAFALRKGFSDRLTGLNVPEEIGAINNENGAMNYTPETPIQPELSEEGKKIKTVSAQIRDLLPKVKDEKERGERIAELTQQANDFKLSKTPESAILDYLENYRDDLDLALTLNQSQSDS